MKPATTAVVRSLLGHSHVDMAIGCLDSLLRYSRDRLRLVIHDEGTLTAGDRERLAGGLEAEVLAAEEGEARIAALLADRPNSLAFRKNNPLARKLLDIPLLEEGEAVAYCDSDILFLRPFRGLYRFPHEGVGAVFQSDRQDAYSFRSWQLARSPRLRLPQRVNSGIVHFRKRHYDQDLIEWFLGRDDLHRTPAWVEQTAWALLGRRAGCHLIDPHQIGIPTSEPQGSDPVALHFVSPMRDRLEAARAGARDRRGEDPVEIGTFASPACGFWSLLASELRRRLSAPPRSTPGLRPR